MLDITDLSKCIYFVSVYMSTSLGRCFERDCVHFTIIKDYYYFNCDYQVWSNHSPRVQNDWPLILYYGPGLKLTCLKISLILYRLIKDFI